MRLCPNGAFNGMGSPDNVETFTHVIRQLDAMGLMYLHVMDGLAFGFHAKDAVFRAAHGIADETHYAALAALGVSAAQWKAAELRLAIAHAVAGGK